MTISNNESNPIESIFYGPNPYIKQKIISHPQEKTSIIIFELDNSDDLSIILPTTKEGLKKLLSHVKNIIIPNTLITEFENFSAYPKFKTEFKSSMKKITHENITIEYSGGPTFLSPKPRKTAKDTKKDTSFKMCPRCAII